MKRTRSLFILLSFFISFLQTHSAHAQSNQADVSIVMVPSNPDPGSIVLLEARSFGADLDLANMNWKYNGKVIVSGTGQKKISVTAPLAGQTGIVTLTVSGIGYGATTTSIAIRPASVDLLWEAADAYTPPFYKGKAMFPVNGLVKITAIPAISAPRNLSYTWSKNGSAEQSSSGYGKSSFVWKHSEFNPKDQVAVEAKGGLYNGTASITVTPTSPSVVAYQNKEGFIDYARGFGSMITLNQPGAILHFEPYYFSAPRSISSDLTVEMTNNNIAVGGDPRPNEIRVSRPESPVDANLKVAISTAVYSLQHLERIFTIAFR